MRILLINQFFWPDSSATSQLLTDLAVGLSQRGHEVHSISADSQYNLASAGKPPDVIMHRVKSLRFNRGRIGRLTAYLSFYLSGTWSASTIPQPDLVVTLTTPPLVSLLGTILKVLRGCRHFIWEMDVYPDVATDLNYFKAGGIVDRSTGALADFSRRHADGIIALGECMKQRLVRRGLNAERIFVADNWADGSAIQPLPRTNDLDCLVLLYSGNLGLAHDLDTLTGAILALKADQRFRFVFVGSGGRRDELQYFAERNAIDSVELRPYVDRATLGESLSVGDIGLVTQRNVCCGSVVPSKVYGLLAAGKPILFIGPQEATPASIIRRFNCGWHVNCGDIDGMTQLLRHLVTNPDKVKAAGRNGRAALLQHYDLPLGVERIANILGAGLAARDHSSIEQPALAARSI